MAAVLESIAEVGFQRTTAAEITRRAGVTWGAVQHHFGAEDGILRAVLEHYTIAVLSGLATTLMLEGPAAAVAPEELGFLKDTHSRAS